MDLLKVTIGIIEIVIIASITISGDFVVVVAAAGCWLIVSFLVEITEKKPEKNAM